MFTLKGNVIESDEGFSVQTLGRAGLKYSEGQRSVFIESELLAPGCKYSMTVLKSSIRCWIGDNVELAIDQPTRDEIIENIRQAYCSQNQEIEFI